MKHYIFHLLSVVLLIILFLVVLDLARDKQGAEKAAGEFEAKYAASEKTLEQERTENAAKNAGLEAENKDLQGKLDILETSISEMERRFQVVSARDVKMLGLTFEQTPRSDADAATAMTLADSLKAPTPAAFKEAAEKMLEPLFSSTRELVLDSESGCVVDSVAAIVETAAKAANLSASTVIFWDVSRKQFRSEVTVSDPAKKEKNAVVSIGGNPKTFRDTTFQLSPKTTAFPFTDISLLSRNSVDLLTRTASIPLGGLYVHYFRVYSKGPWVLEYIFPEKLEPESVNMNLLPLTPGSSISSSVMGRTYTFHINVENKEVDFLVIADHPFFPDSASIRLKP